jgi:hypothetical protein
LPAFALFLDTASRILEFVNIGFNHAFIITPGPWTPWRKALVWFFARPTLKFAWWYLSSQATSWLCPPEA